MSNLKDNFTEFLSKVEQMEKDNEKLTEDVHDSFLATGLDFL